MGVGQQHAGLAVAQDGLDRFEAEERDFFDRVRKAYQDLAKAEPGRNLEIGSGSPTLVKIRPETTVTSDSTTKIQTK